MKGFILGLLIKAVQYLVGGDVFRHVEALVRAQVSSDLPGEQKRAVVQEQLKNVKGELADTIRHVSQGLLNLAIEAAVVLINK